MRRKHLSAFALAGLMFLLLVLFPPGSKDTEWNVSLTAEECKNLKESDILVPENLDVQPIYYVRENRPEQNMVAVNYMIPLTNKLLLYEEIRTRKIVRQGDPEYPKYYSKYLDQIGI